MRKFRTALLAGAIATVVVAGCGSAVDGSAQPNAAAASALALSPASPSGAPSSAGSPGSPSPGITLPSSPPPGSPQSTAPPTSSGPATSDGSAPPTSGQSSPGSSGQSAPQTYSTAPAPFPKTPTSQDEANQIEARRIAGYLVVPTFIDDTYTQGGGLSTFPLRGPQAMAVLFGSAPMPSVAQRAGMINGFSSSRSDAHQNDLLVSAFEFGSAAQAKAAVPLLAAAAADKTSDKGKAVVPGFTSAAGWYGTISGGGPYFQSFLAQGQMVLYLYISGTKLGTPAAQAALAAKTFTAQTASMGKYVPTPSAKFNQLPVDPDGLRAHTLQNAGDDATVNDGLLTAAGQLHYDTDPIGTKAVFANAGVDEVSDGRASVYRAKDGNGAVLVQSDFIAYTQNSQSGMQPFTLTAAVPNARCLQQALNSYYYCVGTQGRYAFEISAQSEADINAAAAAQYALLQGF